MLHGFLLSPKHSTVDTCGVHVVCLTTVYARICAVLLAILLYFTPLFNPSACSPLNHIGKTVSSKPTTIFCSYYFMQYLVSILHLIISSIRSLNIYPHHFLLKSKVNHKNVLYHTTTVAVQIENTKELWNIYLLSKTENEFWLPRYTYNALQSGIT